MNKEVLFAKTLEQVRKTAKEQGNCISEEQVKVNIYRARQAVKQKFNENSEYGL